MNKFIFLLVLFSYGGLRGQDTCIGNLGDNNFEMGDFGLGQDNVVQIDPGIAPGFNYTTSMPPDDGYYTITNDMRDWSDTFGSWLRIPDNSSDPDGYMMVVNSSFDPGLFFIQEIDGLCENTLYQFTADIINITRNGNPNQILPNVSFLIDGIDQISSGDIPQDELWHTYGFSFTTDPTQTSVVLALRNNAPGGFGNDLALDNISFKPCGPVLNTLILPDALLCEDDMNLTIEVSIDAPTAMTFVQWQVSDDGGMNWADIIGATDMQYQITNLSSGFFLYRYLYGNSLSNLLNEKCRILSNESEVEIIAKEFNLIDTICDGMTYSVGESIYTSSGLYLDSLTNRLGCDSLVTLDLTVLNNDLNFNVEHRDPLCHGERDGSINVIDILNASLPVEITINDSLVQRDQLPFITGGGMYNVGVEDRYGCRAEKNIDLIDPDIFRINEFGRLEIPLGESVRLLPIGNYPIDSAVWNGGIEFSCLDCFDPLVMPINTDTFSAVFWTENGCRDDVEFTIDVLKVRSIFFPDAFTPNDDGTNDVFSILGNPAIVANVNYFRIFNRWGNMVYNMSDLNIDDSFVGWDGRYFGLKQPTGVYIYTCEIDFIDGETIEYQGSMSLLR